MIHPVKLNGHWVADLDPRASSLQSSSRSRLPMVDCGAYGVHIWVVAGHASVYIRHMLHAYSSTRPDSTWSAPIYFEYERQEVQTGRCPTKALPGTFDACLTHSCLSLYISSPPVLSYRVSCVCPSHYIIYIYIYLRLQLCHTELVVCVLHITSVATRRHRAHPWFFIKVRQINASWSQTTRQREIIAINSVKRVENAVPDECTGYDKHNMHKPANQVNRRREKRKKLLAGSRRTTQMYPK